MKNNRENKQPDISRPRDIEFRHYQLMIKMMRLGVTEHHHLEVFTTPQQLLEMRRVYTAVFEKSDYKIIQRCSKNN